MTAPTRPYSTPSQVSYLLQNRFYGQSPSALTVPSSTVITQLIVWADGVIEMEFHAVGYKMPFAEISGETWPTPQTTLLSYMSAIGAAAMAGGHILKPAPAMSPGNKGSQGSVYGKAFEAMQAHIKEDGYRFRSQYYSASKAEKWIAESYGPRMDFLEDYYDPTRYMLLKEYTEEMQGVFQDITEFNIDWDYLYRLRSAN